MHHLPQTESNYCEGPSPNPYALNPNATSTGPALGNCHRTTCLPRQSNWIVVIVHSSANPEPLMSGASSAFAGGDRLMAITGREIVGCGESTCHRRTASNRVGRPLGSSLKNSGPESKRKEALDWIRIVIRHLSAVSVAVSSLGSSASGVDRQMVTRRFCKHVGPLLREKTWATYPLSAHPNMSSIAQQIRASKYTRATGIFFAYWQGS